MTDEVEIIFSRCGEVLSRALAGRVDDAELAAVAADVHRLPDGPRTSALAAALIVVLARTDPNAAPRRLRHIDGLLAVADRHTPPDPSWPATRACARAMSMLCASIEGRLPDPGLALKELDELEAEAGDDQAVRTVLHSARSALGYMYAVRGGDDSAMGRMAGEVAEFTTTFSGVPGTGPMLDVLAQAGDLASAHGRGEDLAPRLRQLQDAVANLPPGHPMHAAMAEMDTMIGPMLAMSGGASGGLPSDDQVAAMVALAEQPGISDNERALHFAAACGAILGLGHEIDPARLDKGVDYARRAVALSSTDDPQRVFHLSTLALALFRRREVTGAVADIVAAEPVLVEARELAGGAHHPQWSEINEMLAHARRQMGAVRPHETALEGLRRHAYNVMLQSDPALARRAAAAAVRDALDAAHMCLVEGDPADAMRALDAGRGLMLFAATRLRDLGTRLEELGERELAERWRTARTKSSPEELPTGLRQDVLRALSADTGVLDPPAFADVQRALSTLDADALVYLVPARDPNPGWAVIAPASGPPSYMALPNLAIGAEDVERYFEALVVRDAGSATRRRPPDDEEFRKRLDKLCDWAWRAAIGPLLETYLPRSGRSGADRLPHLFLIPMGDLARIPWQAARRRDGTYAVQLAGLSQAASARMLCDTAGRAPVPPAPVGLVVGDPATEAGVVDLAAARREARAIHRVFYRGGRYVGRMPDGGSTSLSGAGTIAQVREWLTSGRAGAGSMLHLACHGFVDLDAGQSYLLLAPDGDTGDGKLSATELVDLMAGSPQRNIGLVVLAACRTGLAINGYDDAYSLGTAFLASGVRSVLSTQWSIPDVDTSVLMFMFHHYRMVDRLPVWEAIRRAQAWMLAPEREVPGGMPGPLRDQLARTDPTRVAAWAGFVHGGQ